MNSRVYIEFLRGRFHAGRGCVPERVHAIGDVGDFRFFAGLAWAATRRSGGFILTAAVEEQQGTAQRTCENSHWVHARVVATLRAEEKGALEKLRQENRQN